MIVLTDPDKKVRTAIAEFIGEPDDLGVVQVDTPAKLDKMLTDPSISLEVILIGPGVDPKTALDLASTVQQTSPEISVILLAKTLDPNLLRSALRYGVKDVLPEPFSRKQLQEAVERAQGLARSLRGRSGAVAAHTPGEFIHQKSVTVFSWKGGCGKSFLSSNLAVLLAQKTSQEVALVDLDLQSGDLAIMLQLQPKWTMYDAAERLDGLDADE
ncbi:MAG: AAA family ATPase, partial [Acidimicrobiia bacterium]